MKKTICYVAGKSGGHIIPAMTHAQNSQKINPDYQVLFFSTNTELDRSIISKYSCVDFHKPLNLGNIPRKNIFAWPKFSWQLSKTFWSVFRTLYRLKPVKIVSMGGYISVPVCLVARMLRMPIEVYELNVVPGEAVKLLSRFASVTRLCFEKTKYYLPKWALCSLDSYPIRYGVQDKLSKQEACKKLGINPEKKIICVLGGSQGSQFLNKIVTDFAGAKGADSHFFIHQTGARNIEAVRKAYKQYGVDALVFAFRDDLNVCYSAADKIVARAGAGTLFEILYFNKPALIVPLEAATTGHQMDNAQAMAAAHPHLFHVIPQKTLEAHPQNMLSLL